MPYLKVSKYRHKENYSASLLKKHRKMFQADYQIFNAYNATLWKTIKTAKQDFYAELYHFKNILKKLYMFCNTIRNRVLDNIETNVRDVLDVLHSKEKVVIPESSWNTEFAWDSVDCMLAYVGKKL